MEEVLKPGHVIDTLRKEHDAILSFLDGLEKINSVIQEKEVFQKDDEDFGKLSDIAEHLVGAEPHHKREEDALFPELEKRGVSAPPATMRSEHEEIRPKKKEILDLSKNVQNMDFTRFKNELNAATDFVVPMLKEHIFKENEILYPLALEHIKEEAVWRKMKEDCDKIGYCCFTPEA